MLKPLVTIIGKSVRQAARLRGGGTALPGLVVEKIDSNFVKKSLDKFPMGVVMVSGTNGKTTTTKIVVEMLQASGLKVFTNKTGSNFSRGVAASLIEDMSLNGKIKADIAVLELDEAHAVNFAETIKPRYLLLLNVMRDQLDRFGEIDKTAKMLGKVVSSTTQTVVLNREDPLIASQASQAKCSVVYYGLSPKLKSLFPSDKELHDNRTIDSDNLPATVTLESTNDHEVIYKIDDKMYPAKLKINGLYNFYNAAGALAVVSAILKNIENKKLITYLQDIEPSFGRGETIHYMKSDITLVLVKNPSGFRLAIESFSKENIDTMIVINDRIADSRDVSWLWDVNFAKLKNKIVSVVSGLRADDMALRLKYDDIETTIVETDIDKALKQFVESGSKQKLIFCTYTAMLEVRKRLTNKKPLGEK